MADKLIFIVFHSVQICADLSILYLGLYMDWRLGDLRKVCVVEQYQTWLWSLLSYSVSISSCSETCRVPFFLDMCLSYFEHGRFIQFPAKRCHRQIAEDPWNNSEAWHGVSNIINIMTVVKIYCYPHQTLSLILVPFFCSEKYLQNLLQIEVMLKTWFPQQAFQSADTPRQTITPRQLPPHWHQNQLHMPVKVRIIIDLAFVTL